MALLTIPIEHSYHLLFPFLIFLCIGSFLNVVAWRVIQGQNIYSRSACTSCHSTIAWYDLLPVVSWLLLRGKCRHCKETISFLYPFIELLSALLLTAMLAYTEPRYWLCYGIFLSALIVTIRTDIETMLIARIATLYLIPLGWLLSYLKFLPITFTNSFVSSILGYALLWAFAELFYRLRGIRGMGEGDFELLAFIGAFTGIFGIWSAITIGSMIGSIYGLFIIATHKSTTIRIPFGPFLALGTIVYLFCGNYFLI